MIKKIIAICISFSMLMTFFNLEAYAMISSVGDPSLVNSQVQNNNALKDEQVKVTTSGSTLNIKGRTQLSPLPCTGNQKEVYVSSFKHMETGKEGYLVTGMTPKHEVGQDGKIVYAFEGSVDFSSAIDGTYVMYLWRGRQENGRYYFGSKAGKGILTYDTILRVKDGKVSILRYNNILSENKRVYAEINTVNTSKYLDKTLDDIAFVNRDPRIEGDKGKPLSKSEISYIKKITEQVTAGCVTDYQKLKKIYEFVAKNMYYDTVRNANGKAYANPYKNLYNLKNKVSNGYNAKNGKVASVCTGYSAMVTAMARTIGIPTRLVKGNHPAIEKIQWPNVEKLNKENHHWPECYVGGRWIMVDATMGTQNKYDAKVESWTTTGVSNYTYFDPTEEQIAVHYLVQGIYDKTTSGGGYVSTEDKVKNTEVSFKIASKPGSILLEWVPVGYKEVDGYEIYRSVDNKTNYILYKDIKGQLKYTDSSLISGKTYYYKIKGYKNIDGKKVYTKWSQEAGKVAQKIDVEDIENASIAITSKVVPGSINLDWWNKSEGINLSGYELYRSVGNKDKFELYDTTTSSLYSDRFVTAGENYYYKVRGYKNVNEKKVYTKWSLIVGRTAVVDQVAVVKNTVLAIKSKSELGSITVNWWRKEGEASLSGFELYRSVGNKNNFKLYKKTSKWRYIDRAGLINGKNYYYKVRGYKNINGKKVYTKWSFIVGKTARVDQVTSVKNTVMVIKLKSKVGSITANWWRKEGVASLSGFELYRSVGSKNNFRLYKKTSKWSYTDKKSLVKGKNYYYKVRGYKNINGKKVYTKWSIIVGKTAR